MRIVFMGTPDFSVPVMTEILGQGHEIVAVYTRAPKPAGRGMDLRLSPVHALANTFGIPVFTPKSLRDVDEQTRFAALDADIAVVVAYGSTCMPRCCRAGAVPRRSSAPLWRVTPRVA